MKKIFGVVLVVPILALFVGIGVLAYRVSATWDSRNTDVLIANLTAVCGIGGVVVALVLSGFIGVVLYARWQQERAWSVPRARTAPRNQVPAWDGPPPLPVVEEEKKGRLYLSGPASYEDLAGDLFGDT